MGFDTVFAREFVRFLEDRALPADLAAQAVLQRADIMVYALTTKLCGQMGTKLSLVDLVMQGGAGGGGPHRLDALVKYSMEAGSHSKELAAVGRSGIAD